jgi:small subunit ribosomal protein S8
MTHTDPIADMITRLKNGIRGEKKEVIVPLSRVKVEILKLIRDEGYIVGFKLEQAHFPPQIVVQMKYAGRKQNAIEDIKRVSKPGCRVYANAENLPKVLDGLGVAVVSTSQGILTGLECRKRNIGGEVLLKIW